MRSTRIIAVAGLATIALGFGGTAIASAATMPTSTPATTAALTAATTPAPARAEYVVTADLLNIRSGPGVNYRIIGALKKGSLVHANTATVNGFRELRAGVWMSARYLAPTGK